MSREALTGDDHATQDVQYTRGDCVCQSVNV